MLIKNFSSLAETTFRKDALRIINEGLKVISPSFIFKKEVFLENHYLHIKKEKIDLNNFKNIYIVGFGKGAALMAAEIERILGSKIKNGLVIDIVSLKLKRIKIKQGTHPYLSKKNIQASKRIINMIKQAKKDDLVICLIAGGGSALFEVPYNSFINTLRINQKLLTSGASIEEINTIRKHISQVKGGQMVAWTQALIISLIVSDVVGDQLDIIASGPTVFDPSTIKDAQIIIKKYKLPKLKLKETPKIKGIFRKVKNIIIANNKVSLEEMAHEAKKLGYQPRIITSTLTGEAQKVAQDLIRLSLKMKKKEIYLLGGETTVTVRGQGRGGRNTELSLASLQKLPKKCLFISFASDGLDNTDAAGGIADQNTQRKAKDLNLDIEKYLNNNNSYNFFRQTGDLIFTGPTGTNVADLILIMKY